MSVKEVEEKIIQLAHEFASKYGEEVFEIRADELIAYIISQFNYEEYLIFKHNEINMLKLFVQTVKQDLESQNK
jgi:hypothetical protein